MLFSLNAMDEIQDKFGDLGELDKVMGGKDRFKAVRWLLALLLNEGAAEGESPLTEREVGKMIHAGNMAYAQECIFKSIAIGQAGKEVPSEETPETDDDDETEQGNVTAGQEQLGYPEREVWRMTPYKILTLFRIHRQFHPEKWKPEPPEGIDPIDVALGGL